MEERSVVVEIAPDRDEDVPEMEKNFPALREEVAVRGGVTTDPDDEGRYGARFTVAADEPGDAVDEGVDTLHNAARAAGVPEGRVADVEAPTLEELRRDAPSGEMPALVDLSGLGKLLGVNRHLAPIVARSKGFPRPVAELNGGPVWVLDRVEMFLRSAAGQREGGKAQQDEAREDRRGADEG